VILEGKRALIFGVANKRSIAWAIAQSLHREGAELAFTYQGERVESTVRELARSAGSNLVFPCDVQQDAEVDAVFDQVSRAWGGRLDVLVHSLAFTPHEELENRYVESKRDNWLLSLDVSAYSLVALTRRAEPLMREHGGSIITMTYNGSQRATPHYNTMGIAKAALEASVRYLAAELGPEGIRVNAISAGPLRTPAARSIAGFPTMEAIVEERAPLHRHVTAEDVGAAAAYLLGDGAKNVTGTTLYVDSGFHAMGM
jgi:enoyl-[acyl-carrier protein] reductase I